MLTTAWLLLSVLALPTGKPIEFDGRVEIAEWSDAKKLAAKKHDLYLKRNGPWLDLAVVGKQEYFGEVVSIVVSDPAGARQSGLILALGRFTQPPALAIRASAENLRVLLRDRRVPLPAPRGVLCRLAVEENSWSAEYRIRLGALGIGRADRRPFRIRISISGGRLQRENSFVFPEGTTAETPASEYAELTSADGWGAAERWAPVTQAESRIFDDHELLALLEQEQLGQLDREKVEGPTISGAVRPRSRARIDALRDLLEGARKRNPTLPGWSYYLGRLLHEANLYEEAAPHIEAIPVGLRKSPAYLHLAIENLIDTGHPDKAMALAKANARAYGIGEFFHAATVLETMLAEEKKARTRDKDLPAVRFETSKGVFEIELFEDDAPHATRNLVDLVENRKYFDGLKIDRIYGGFLAELGTPRTGENTEGPAWKLRPDTSARSPLRGYLVTVMDESGPADAGRFVIALAPLIRGAGKAAVFGRVSKGMDVVDTLEWGDLIKSATVVRKRNHSYDPKPARVH
ncbi:MAG: peptidylprolyl isomerase [Planctomycetota bacterium]